jgi:class 3 adenylate cyclase/tetratricopeptide (TPR) repeat protein
MDQPGIFQMHQSIAFYCRVCSYRNPDHVRTCLNCDAPLGLVCSGCGQTVPAQSKFCSQCGTRLPESQLTPAVSPQLDELRQNLVAYLPTALAEKIKLASVKLEGERRDVTVLFLEAVNFTRSSYHLDSEDLYLIVDEAMSLLIELVYKYEGTIDKFTGNGLMALFGAPVTHENDPERAIRTALEMMTVIQPLRTRLRETQAFDFQIRVGINTGPVIAGKLGNSLHAEYTVIGDTVNLAARLVSAAEPGTILVNAETYQRTRLLFEFQALPLLTIKGIPQPVRTYRPVGLLKPPGAVYGLQAPMIGRAAELTCLQNALAQVHQHSHSRIALITGEAGLGKSRLVAEFRRTLAGSETRVYQGNCLTYARSTSLWVVTELLRDMAELPKTAPVETQQKALHAYLNRLELSQAEILPYLTRMLGLEQTDPKTEERLHLLDAPMLQQQTHAVLRQIFLAEARLGPTVLIFEDLHEVDPASRDFLEYLIQTTADVPLLLILVSRQAEHQTLLRPLMTAAEQEPEQLVDLPLQALSEAEGTLLVDQLIPKTTVEASTFKLRIAERAQGNPFYVEEIIRMLIDQGGLLYSPASETWEVLPQATSLLNEVPGTIQGLLLARFDRLPEGVRQTLQRVAVLGFSFPLSLLYMLNVLSPQTLATHLKELEAGHFLNPEPFRTEPGYVFRHTLLQETIYGTLLKHDRSKIHAQVAQAIKQSTFWLPEEQTEALAYHYVRSTEPTQAIPYLIAAAENAARHCANETAIEHYRQTIALLPVQPFELSARTKPDDDSQRFFKVRIGLGQALKYVGQFAAAKQVLSEVLQHLENSNVAVDPATLGPILIENLRQLADVEQREGSYAEALAHLEAGFQILREMSTNEQPKLRCSLLDRMAWINFRQGQLKKASALAVAAVDDLKALSFDDPMLLASLFNTLGGVSWQQGELDKATAFVEQSLQLYQNMGYFWGTAIALGNLGILYHLQGSWAKAAHYYQQAYDLHQITGDRQNQANNLDNLGTLHLAMGEHEKAKQELEASLLICQRLGDAWGTAQAQLGLGHLALIQNRLEDTATRAETALSLAESIGSLEMRVQALWILAMVETENGAWQVGLPLAEQALELAQTARLVEKEGDCLRVLGVLHARAGQSGEAEVFLRRSIDFSIKQNDPYRQGQALLELGRVYQRRIQVGQPDLDKWRAEALMTLDKAAKLFEALGAAYDLHLVRTALAQIQAANTALG